MGFWGIELKPGEPPRRNRSDNGKEKLRVNQATLGGGESTGRSILQCSLVHRRKPIFLCSFLPDKVESCSLNLEFGGELLGFSVLGERSIHLSGYSVAEDGDCHQTDSGEDDESFDFDMYPIGRVEEMGYDGVGLPDLKEKKITGVWSPDSATEEGGKAIVEDTQPEDLKTYKKKVKADTEADSKPEKRKKKKRKQKGNGETLTDQNGEKRETEVDERSAPVESASRKSKKKRKNKRAKSSFDSDEKQSASK